MGGTLRTVANMAAAVLALALLGILLLVSSGGDNQRQRLLDQNLRELRELSTVMQSEVVTADGLELDVTDRFRALKQAFDNSLGRLGDVSRLLREDEQGPLRGPRDMALGLFNSIETGGRGLTPPEELRTELTGLSGQADALAGAVDAFTRDQQRYLQQREAVQERGRELVRRLRQRGQEAAADTAFAGLRQALDRVRRAAAGDTAPVEATIRRLREIGVPPGTLRNDLDNLTSAVSSLLASRLRVSEHIGDITGSPFPERAEELREKVAGDYVYGLQTAGDARELLNVYMVMLMVILAYFGVRLQGSHRVLNRSHALLEERVKERTQELESAYDDLKESQVQLVQAEKMSSLGQLVAGVVHEINTPLLYVMNNTDITRESIVEMQGELEPVRELIRCLREPELDKARMKNALTEIRSTLDVGALDESLGEIVSLTSDSQEGLQDIDALVKSLKDFSRLDRQTFDLFDVREGLEKTLLITKNMLKYGIEVERHFDEVPQIRCAPSRVNQVFINLITNAAQAMDGEGQLTISTRAEDEGWVHVTIADTGCGIPEENLQKVLDPFFTTKPVGQGTGLGLSIVRTIMEEHHGKLAIDSTEGEGTEITLSFPVEGAAEAEPEETEAEAA